MYTELSVSASTLLTDHTSQTKKPRLTVEEAVLMLTYTHKAAHT